MAVLDQPRHDVRDAARLAIQSAVAAAGVYALMQALGLSEKFVAVLSAVLVVQPSVGNTLWAGTERLVATLVGCLIGVVCMALLPSGYGTSAALAFSMLVMNGIAGFRPQWRYGVVAAVALALGSESNALQTALERSIGIGVGVSFGMLVSLIIWPDMASTRSQRHLNRALRAIAQCLDGAMRAVDDADAKVDDKARDRYHREIEGAREAAKAVRMVDNSSLVERVRLVERHYYSVLILNRIAERTNEISGDNGELREDIDQIRELTCKIANGLADGDLDQRQRRERIESLLEQVRQRFVEARDEASSHVLRNALVFGLDEVELTIGRLIESGEKAQNHTLKKRIVGWFKSAAKTAPESAG